MRRRTLTMGMVGLAVAAAALAPRLLPHRTTAPPPEPAVEALHTRTDPSPYVRPLVPEPAVAEPISEIEAPPLRHWRPILRKVDPAPRQVRPQSDPGHIPELDVPQAPQAAPQIWLPPDPVPAVEPWDCFTCGMG